jgi:flagellar protein FliS
MTAKNNPYNKYKQTQITTANQGKLIVMLYDGAIKFLNIAIDNMEPRTYDVVNNNILKAQDIVTELSLSLNMNEGGEIATNLFNLYMFFKKRLLEANVQKDAKLVQEVLDNLKVLREAWDQISATETRSDNRNPSSKGSVNFEG